MSNTNLTPSEVEFLSEQMSIFKDIIRAKDDYMDDTYKNHVLLKRLVTWVLKEYNGTRFRSDVRMIILWKLLGKYSGELQIEGVLNKVYELGYFINVPEFYVTWAEFYAEQDYWGKVGEIIKLCKENCGLDDYQSGERFSPIFTKYKKDMASVMNSTMDLFNYLSGSEQQGQQ